MTEEANKTKRDGDRAEVKRQQPWTGLLDVADSSS